MANVRRLDAHLRDAKLRQAMREAEAAKVVATSKSSAATTVAALRGLSRNAAVPSRTKPCGCTGTTQHHPAPRATHRGCRGAAPVSNKPTSVDANQNPKPAPANARASARTNISRPPPVPTPPAPSPFEQFLRPRPGPAPAPANPTPIQACTGQLFPTPFPKPLSLPISQLDPSLPVPMVIDGLERYSYKSPPSTKDLGTPGGRIGGTAIIPAGVDVTKVSRVMFWMQGQGLNSRDAKFIEALLPVAQISRIVILVMDSDSTQGGLVSDRREQIVRFVNNVSMYGFRLENGVDLRLTQSPYICLAGWSRGASAAIEAAAGVAKTKLRPGLKISSVVSVAPTSHTGAGTGANPASVLAARFRLSSMDAVFVTSSGDGDTNHDGFEYFPAFGSGSGIVVHFTAACTAHTSLVASSLPAQSGCLGGAVFLPGPPPDCYDALIGPRWLTSVTWMLGGDPWLRKSWIALSRGEFAPTSEPGALTMCSQGGAARVPRWKSVARNAADGLPTPIVRDVAFDSTIGPNLRGRLTGLLPSVVLKELISGCSRLDRERLFEGMTEGRKGVLVGVRGGSSVRITFQGPVGVLARNSVTRIAIGAIDFGFIETSFEIAKSKLYIPRVPVCVTIHPGGSVGDGRFFGYVRASPVFVKGEALACGQTPTPPPCPNPWPDIVGASSALETVFVKTSPGFHGAPIVDVVASAAKDTLLAIAYPEVL